MLTTILIFILLLVLVQILPLDGRIKNALLIALVVVAIFWLLGGQNLLLSHR